MNLPISLPGVMCSGKPQMDVSLHEYVVTHLCGYIAAVPARHFHIVEKSLLKNVVNRDWNVVMVAIDVWCFLARWVLGYSQAGRLEIEFRLNDWYS